ncbi:zinc-ribbon domain-containing protein [Roseiconus lacunae]|uniref:zinc-ribbon domain-containing protein n=1 Tax=Roseiconus lacunae TaxID=2605694 RepID=UPI0011F22F96|nr:zinc-ribbon domain-containing protein [Stieleria sp. HD01]
MRNDQYRSRALPTPSYQCNVLTRSTIMIIFGITSKQAVESVGEFQCPACRKSTDCGRIIIAKYMTFFFIPLIPIGRSRTHRFVCKSCGSVYSETAIGQVPHGSSLAH